MKQRLAIFLVIGAAFLALAGCDKIDVLNLFNRKNKAVAAKIISTVAVRGTVIAKVNNLPITLEDLSQEVNAYNAMVPADKPEQKITTREQKIDYLKNELVRRTLLYQDALDRGLEARPEIAQEIEKAKMDILILESIKEIAGKIEASSKEIEDYYNSAKDKLREPEERQLREIAVSSEPEARDILVQLLQGGDFATLAKERSKSSSAKDGGDLGFIQAGAKKSAKFDENAFSNTLEVGRLSNIFKGDDGSFYILKLEAKRGGKQKTLSELWDDIKRGLTFIKQQQAIEELVGKLSREAKLEFYEGVIK